MGSFGEGIGQPTFGTFSVRFPLWDFQMTDFLCQSIKVAKMSFHGKHLDMRVCHAVIIFHLLII